jgi:hypothetical protein
MLGCPGVKPRGILRVEKEVAVHRWMNAPDLALLVGLMVSWLFLVGAVGYAAVVAALRGLRRNVPTGRA